MLERNRELAPALRLEEVVEAEREMRDAGLSRSDAWDTVAARFVRGGVLPRREILRQLAMMLGGPVSRASDLLPEAADESSIGAGPAIVRLDDVRERACCVARAERGQSPCDGTVIVLRGDGHRPVDGDEVCEDDALQLFVLSRYVQAIGGESIDVLPTVVSVALKRVRDADAYASRVSEDLLQALSEALERTPSSDQAAFVRLALAIVRARLGRATATDELVAAADLVYDTLWRCGGPGFEEAQSRRVRLSVWRARIGIEPAHLLRRAWRQLQLAIGTDGGRAPMTLLSARVRVAAGYVLLSAESRDAEYASRRLLEACDDLSVAMQGRTDVPPCTRLAWAEARLTALEWEALYGDAPCVTILRDLSAHCHSSMRWLDDISALGDSPEVLRRLALSRRRFAAAMEIEGCG